MSPRERIAALREEQPYGFDTSTRIAEQIEWLLTYAERLTAVAERATLVMWRPDESMVRDEMISVLRGDDT